MRYQSKISTEKSSTEKEELDALIANEHFKCVMLKAWRIYRAKGIDYTRGKGDEDRLDNFRSCAELFGIDMRLAWGVYFYKQVSALWRFVKDGIVESESVESRALDVINYCVLLLAILDEEKRK